MIRAKVNLSGGAKNVTGSNIAAVRIRCGYTQTELSQKLRARGLDICRDSMCRIECGKRQTTDCEVAIIADTLNVTVGELHANVEFRILQGLEV